MPRGISRRRPSETPSGTAAAARAGGWRDEKRERSGVSRGLEEVNLGMPQGTAPARRPSREGHEKADQGFGPPIGTLKMPKGVVRNSASQTEVAASVRRSVHAAQLRAPWETIDW